MEKRIVQIIPAPRWFARTRRSKHEPGMPSESRIEIVCFALYEGGDIQAMCYGPDGGIIRANSIKDFVEVAQYEVE